MYFIDLTWNNQPRVHCRRHIYFFYFPKEIQPVQTNEKVSHKLFCKLCKKFFLQPSQKNLKNLQIDRSKVELFVDPSVNFADKKILFCSGSAYIVNCQWRLPSSMSQDNFSPFLFPNNGHLRLQKILIIEENTKEEDFSLIFSFLYFYFISFSLDHWIFHDSFSRFFFSVM